MIAKILRFITKLIILLSLLFINLKILPRSYVIFITSYNNIKWCKENIKSALNQKEVPYRIVFIDDHSTDGTGDMVEKIVKNWRRKHKSSLEVSIIHNKIRHGALSNWYRVIHACKDDEIIVSLDGDDCFAHNKILLRLEQEYTNDCWLTYGQWIGSPSKNLGQNRPLDTSVSVRDQPFVTSHLRTFYAGLFKQIKLTDFLDDNDRFYRMAWDVALMLPMLEMCKQRYAFIPEILYIYNCNNPISDGVVNLRLQNNLANQIKAKKSYNPIDTYRTNLDLGSKYVILGRDNYKPSSTELNAASYVVINLTQNKFTIASENLAANIKLLRKTGLDCSIIDYNTKPIHTGELISPLNNNSTDTYVTRAKNLTIHSSKYIILTHDLYLQMLNRFTTDNNVMDNFLQLSEFIINDFAQINNLVLYAIAN